VFTIDGLNGELRQSEIITEFVQYTFDPVAEEGVSVRRPYAIVMTQDCDLLWDYRARLNGEPRELNGVLLYELDILANVRDRLAPGKETLRRLRRHAEPRFHFLQLVPPELDRLRQGLPELVIDFKRCYTMPADEIYRQCELQKGAKRRCRLDVLYCEHLQNRAAHYLQRVALPEDRVDQSAAAAPVVAAPAPAVVPVAADDPGGDAS